MPKEKQQRTKIGISVSRDLWSALKLKAKEHHRSANGEAIEALTVYLSDLEPEAVGVSGSLRPIVPDGMGKTIWMPNDLYERMVALEARGYTKGYVIDQALKEHTSR